MAADKKFPLDNFAMIPITINQSHDQILMNSTQDRIKAISNEIPPLYLRTLLDTK